MVDIPEKVIKSFGRSYANGLKPSDNRFLAYLKKFADFLLATEVIWETVVIVYVYASIVAIAPSTSYSTWLLLVVASIPFILRKLRWGYFSARTPFDVPILIFLAAAFVGLFSSNISPLSIGVFQSCLIGIIFYYEVVNYKFPRFGLIFLLVGFSIWSFILPFWSFSGDPSLMNGLSPFNAWFSKLATYLPVSFQPAAHSTPFMSWVYGIVLIPMIIMSIVAGITIFSRRDTIRIAGAVFCLILVFMILATMGEGLNSLFSGSTLATRQDLWSNTITAIKGSPITGLGLGMPKLFEQGVFLERLTHPHNSYLEFYANFGLLGAIAVAISLIILAVIVYKVMRSPKNNAWYGFAAGAVLACLIMGFFSIFTTSLSGFIVWGFEEEYYYTVSPVPWALGGLLVGIRRVLESD